MEIKIDIKDCSQCTHFESERVYTADSFEMPFKWMCKKADNRVISSFVEWHDKIAIPDWCPCRIEPHNMDSMYGMILKSNMVYLNDKVVKNRYGKWEDVRVNDIIYDAEVVSYDENTRTLYLKTK